MQCVILCGGLGTRIRSHSQGLPKALIEVEGKSILERQFEQLNGRVSEVVLLAGLKSNTLLFTEFLQAHRNKYSFDIQIAYESNLQGTLGALKSIEELLRPKFIVIMGDVLFDVDCTQLVNYLGLRTSIAFYVRRTDHPDDSDLVIFNSESMKIKDFKKYPHDITDAEFDTYGLTGVFALKRKALKKVKSEGFSNLTELLLAFRNSYFRGLRPIVSMNSFKDLGTPERLEQGPQLLNEINGKKKCDLFIVDRDDTLIPDPAFNHQDLTINVPLIKSIQKRMSGSKGTLIIATNQPRIAKGQITDKEFESANVKLMQSVAKFGLSVDGVYFCPHHPKKGFNGEVEALKVVCMCRKPRPGLVVAAVKELNLSPQQIVVYGDSARDFLLARLIGARFAYFPKNVRLKELRLWFRVLVLNPLCTNWRFRRSIR